MVDSFSDYSFVDGYGICGDNPGTPTIDEGATGGEILKILAKDVNTGIYNLGDFSTGTLATDGFNLTPGRCNIEITNEEIGNPSVVPEPDALGLITLGIGAMIGLGGFRRRE